MWDMFPFSSAVLAISLGMLFLGTAVPLLIFYWIEHQDNADESENRSAEGIRAVPEEEHGPGLVLGVSSSEPAGTKSGPDSEENPKQWRMVQRRGHRPGEKAVCLRRGGEESHLRPLLSRVQGGPANTITCLHGPLSSDSLPCSASAGPPPPGPPRGKGQVQGQGRSNGCVFYPTPDFYALQPLPAPVPKVQRLSLAWPEEEEEEEDDSNSDISGSCDMGKPPGCVLGLCHLAQALTCGLLCKAHSLDTLFTVISEDVAFEEVTETPGDTLLGSPQIPPPLSGSDSPASSLNQRASLKKRAKRAFRKLCCLC